MRRALVVGVVGAGQGEVVARMGCVSGRDGSDVLVHASAPPRIRP
jgi:hypothetical protein